MEGVLILERAEGVISSRVDAAMARYENGRWFFYRGVERHFDAQGVETTVRSFDRWPWDIEEKPNDFMIESNQREEDLLQLSISQLNRIIRILKITGADYHKQLVCLHVRISYPFSCVVLALLGVSLPFLFPYGQRA